MFFLIFRDALSYEKINLWKYYVDLMFYVKIFENLWKTAVRKTILPQYISDYLDKNLKR